MTHKNDPITALPNNGFPSDRSVMLASDLIGLTNREYFAALALQGLASHFGTDDIPYQAKNAVNMADELIRALNE